MLRARAARGAVSERWGDATRALCASSERLVVRSVGVAVAVAPGGCRGDDQGDIGHGVALVVVFGAVVESARDDGLDARVSGRTRKRAVH